jgi:hypothetical protein
LIVSEFLTLAYKATAQSNGAPQVRSARILNLRLFVFQRFGDVINHRLIEERHRIIVIGGGIAVTNAVPTFRMDMISCWPI